MRGVWPQAAPRRSSSVSWPTECRQDVSPWPNMANHGPAPQPSGTLDSAAHLRTNRYRQTPLPHHNNCEHMANWCATGWYTDSHQIRACFHGLSVIGIAETILPAGRRRTSPSRRLVLTRGIIDAAALARMKPGGLLVNVARGPLVATDAMV